MENWFQNLKAKIFGNPIGVVEHLNNGEWWMMTDTKAFNERKLKFWYSINNPVLCAVLTTRAQLFSQMEITHLRNGEKVENSPIIKGLNNPNYFQSKQDFLFNMNWYAGVYGTDYVYYNLGLFDKNAPKFLYNLDNNKIDFQDSFKLKKFIRTEQDIKEFEKRKIIYTHDDGATSNIELTDIVPIYDTANGVNKIYKGHSRLDSILDVLDNIQENIQSKNINLQFSKKYIGVNKTDLQGQPLITEDDRRSIKRAVGNNNLQITNGNIDFKHLVSDFKRLYLDEMYQSDAMTVINAYGLNVDVINYALKNSTFDNQELGIIRVIQNNIQVQADNVMNSFHSAFKMPENEKLVASYDHLPVMQALMEKKINVFNSGIDAINKAKESGLIDENTAKEKAEQLMNKLKI